MHVLPNARLTYYAGRPGDLPVRVQRGSRLVDVVVPSASVLPDERPPQLVQRAKSGACSGRRPRRRPRPGHTCRWGIATAAERAAEPPGTGMPAWVDGPQGPPGLDPSVVLSSRQGQRTTGSARLGNRSVPVSHAAAPSSSSRRSQNTSSGSSTAPAAASRRPAPAASGASQADVGERVLAQRRRARPGECRWTTTCSTWRPHRGHLAQGPLAVSTGQPELPSVDEPSRGRCFSSLDSPWPRTAHQASRSGVDHEGSGVTTACSAVMRSRRAPQTRSHRANTVGSPIA